ncbi:MAG: hypothetical protein BJ554DRAFT_8330 [Olpidium bornovanus]|uniref:Uncharacterized protein n=1 Tax=Olpidium bornovanus TaxID=278681 RepID=A0A8H7ZUZ3_9FUNG|nr:MAG: hypothetical protein BJ554DRAFT_8330 [Olpidium bornovanus]
MAVNPHPQRPRARSCLLPNFSLSPQLDFPHNNAQKRCPAPVLSFVPPLFARDKKCAGHPRRAPPASPRDARARAKTSGKKNAQQNNRAAAKRKKKQTGQPDDCKFVLRAENEAACAFFFFFWGSPFGANPLSRPPLLLPAHLDAARRSREREGRKKCV